MLPSGTGTRVLLWLYRSFGEVWLRPMQGTSPEPWQRRMRYLELAAEAIRSAAQSNTPEMRNAYLSIAYSWMELARDIEPRRD